MSSSPQSWAEVRPAMHEALRGWIYDPNVRFIDFGWRERDGKAVSDDPCIRIHVVRKFVSGPALEAATREGLTRGPIPKMIGGIPVDVPQGTYDLHQWRWGSGWSWGTVRQQPTSSRAARQSPMRGGISIAGSRLLGYGTLGGAVIDRKSGDRMILSNWHVLVGYWDVRPGAPVFQPGRGDGGGGNDLVARYVRDAMALNLDAAVAELTGERSIINNQVDIGPVAGAGPASLGMEVTKSGRRTNVTHGVITGLGGTARMNYRGIDRLVRNVMTIDPPYGQEVSAGGDSGSFWLDKDTRNVVGLHFAGSNDPERALAIDILPILDALQVDMAVD